FVVNPQTGEVLASPTRLAADAERFSTWRCTMGSNSGLMNDVMRDAMHSLLEEVARDRVDGYPNRFAVDDVARFVVDAPDVHQNGALIRGLGWHHPLPVGWRFSASAGPSGGAVSPNGTELFAKTQWCVGTTALCAGIYANLLRSEGADLVDRYDVEYQGETASEFELRTPDGGRVYARVIGAEGVTLTLFCQAPANVPEHDLGACQQAFEGARLETTVRRD
ncbi:MAG: hypothetical protein JRH11_14060, partial [Deltaproteobacteria bacterium]|nr:hypothetical protein [Deltaproteobacteria bacterium]